jgi:hypothetical protein
VKATINIEFTDDELKKHAEDVGRRWVVNFFQEAFKTGKRLKIPPGFVESLASALTGSKPQADPGPVAGAPPPLERCMRLEETELNDENWLCCHCSAMNGVHRAACRLCNHGRCDVIVPPPPAPRQTDPSVQ